MDVRAEYEGAFKSFQPQEKKPKTNGCPCGRNPSVSSLFFSCVPVRPDARAGIHKAGNEAGLEKRKTNMTTNNETKNKPTYEAFTVREGQKGRRSHFTKVGTAWKTKDGKGMTLYLDALPHDGKLILMPPLPPKPKAQETETVNGDTETVDDDGPHINDEVQF